MKNAISLAKNVSTISLIDVSCQDQPLKQEHCLRLIKKLALCFVLICLLLSITGNQKKHIYLPWRTQQLYRHQQIVCKEYSPIQTRGVGKTRDGRTSVTVKMGKTRDGTLRDIYVKYP